ncbi:MULTISPECIES: threonine aldolase family protein [Variovorax]|uniref:threonine aldolase family protein n=1 Tax=Variovorax TaxID=34072 RepID=UPI002864EE80|nr:beta-eliminating lyase-related protein [Variovorax sp. 3319]MDR6890993.1 threonine aldolase [Variovorax sp. 3319]
MNFLSDGTAYAADEVMARLTAYRPRTSAVFESDPVTFALRQKVSDIFEREVDVFPVTTGTAANSLAIAALTKPYGSVLCHWDAHIDTDECGGPVMFSGGVKLTGLDGEHGKIDRVALIRALESARVGVVHRVQPMVLSITQSTEAGTIYTPDELRDLTAVAKRRGLRVHMDGARFANALAATGAAPAELSWKAGIDILCLGATKNGAIAAEAIIVFDRSVSEHLRFLQKRSGHFVAKSALISTQLDAYLTDDLWLKNATHANRLGQKLASVLRKFPEIAFVNEPQANQSFVAMPDELLQYLLEARVQFNQDWRTAPVRHHRFSASFRTTDEEIDELDALAASWISRRSRVTRASS